jgi:hypothetical protein
MGKSAFWGRDAFQLKMKELEALRRLLGGIYRWDDVLVSREGSIALWMLGCCFATI